jgi:hypothetical protein
MSKLPPETQEMYVQNAFSMIPISSFLFQTLMTLQAMRSVQHVRSVSAVAKSANGMPSSSFVRPLDWRDHGTLRHLVRLPYASSLTLRCVLLTHTHSWFFVFCALTDMNRKPWKALQDIRMATLS